ncbi:MAG TPA: hypothetical protein VGO00_13170, partial [Kofleriaceae bacterium]|nr:hypothetical protein [Kofleriaceae bacterium]
YDTKAAQLRQVIDGIDRLLRTHPKIWPNDIVVRFTNLGQSSLDIELIAWFDTRDFVEFRNCRQEILLGIMEIVERSGSAFAFPTRTIITRPS